MTCISLDLTIDGALADPVIAAAMRADRVDPDHFERLLRSTARDLQDTRPKAPLFAHLADQVCSAVTGTRLLW